MKKRRIYKILLVSILFSILFFGIAKTAQGIRLAPGSDVFGKIAKAGAGLTLALSDPLLTAGDLFAALCVTGVCGLAVLASAGRKGKFRRGSEFGSARWGNRSDILPFLDKDPSNNLILTDTKMLSMDPRPKNPACARNKNVLVVGGSGSGKTRFFVKPNLIQNDCRSVVVTDPKGTLLTDCGTFLADRGYRIKVFNTVNFKKSMHYNPFVYIRSEKDILKFVTVLMENTRGENRSSSDDFWVKAEALLYSSLIGYMMVKYDEDERNFASFVDLVSSLEVREDNENFVSGIDKKFKDLEKDEKTRNCFALRQYRKYKLAAGDATM